MFAFIADMTMSELMTIMTAGMAHISGGIMAAYVLVAHVDIIHLLTAVIMTAPGAIMMAKIIVWSEVSRTTALPARNLNIFGFPVSPILYTLEGRARDEREPCARRVDAAVARHLGEPEHDQRQARRDQQHPEPVEPSGVLAGVAARQEAHGQRDADDPDRDVDEEDPAPREVVHDETAECRAEDGRKEHRHADDAHHAAHPLGPRGLRHEDHPDGHDHAAADALKESIDGEGGWDALLAAYSAAV